MTVPTPVHSRTDQIKCIVSQLQPASLQLLWVSWRLRNQRAPSWLTRHFMSPDLLYTSVCSTTESGSETEIIYSSFLNVLVWQTRLTWIPSIPDRHFYLCQISSWNLILRFVPIFVTKQVNIITVPYLSRFYKQYYFSKLSQRPVLLCFLNVC
jgi:hypothetical protein